jgi:methionine-rich copper-binding protein CopC
LPLPRATHRRRFHDDEKSMRVPLLLSLCIASAFMATGTALAHSKLKSSVPANNSTVAGHFKEVRLDFLEPIEAALSYFTLIGADEAVVLRADGAQSCTGKICRFAVEPLKAGKYRIDYHILSADGHVVEGKIGFTVKADQ